MRPRGGITGLSGIDGAGGASVNPFAGLARVFEIDILDAATKIFDDHETPVVDDSSVARWIETNSINEWTTPGPYVVYTPSGVYDPANSAMLSGALLRPEGLGQDDGHTIYFYGIIGGTGGGPLLGNGESDACLNVSSTAGFELRDSTNTTVFGEELGELPPTDSAVLMRFRHNTGDEWDVTWTGASGIYNMQNEGIDTSTIGFTRLFSRHDLSGDYYMPGDMRVQAICVWAWESTTNRQTLEEAYETLHGGILLR